MPSSVSFFFLSRPVPASPRLRVAFFRGQRSGRSPPVVAQTSICAASLLLHQSTDFLASSKLLRFALAFVVVADLEQLVNPLERLLFSRRKNRRQSNTRAQPLRLAVSDYLLRNKINRFHFFCPSPILHGTSGPNTG